MDKHQEAVRKAGNLEQYKKYVAQEVAEQDKRIKAYEEKITKRPITVTGRRTQKV